MAVGPAPVEHWAAGSGSPYDSGHGERGEAVLHQFLPGGFEQGGCQYRSAMIFMKAG